MVRIIAHRQGHRSPAVPSQSCGTGSLALSSGWMGLFHVGCRVLNPVTSKSTTVRRLMVDTGAESTWIDATVLEAIGIERRKKDLHFQFANGQIITRSVGYAVLRVDRSETVDEVVSLNRVISNYSAHGLWKV